MTSIIDKFKSYNYLTKIFAISFLFLLLSSFEFFETLFLWGMLFIGTTGAYHLYKIFSDTPNSFSSPLLSQEYYDKGENNFEMYFLLTFILCLGLGMYFSLFALSIFFVAKSAFINNEEKLKNYNFNFKN